MSSSATREAAIVVEGLGKSYRLQHRASERYVALREVIARKARAAGKAILTGRAPRTDEQEEEFWALREVSFEVLRGEVLGIVGRNGAGKSTLLKLLSRITEPTTGRIRIRGRVASLLEVGTGFHPELTGRENIFLNGAILGMSSGDIRRRFDEIVAFAEVERFLDTPVKRFSSGMYMRLAFAVAAHLDPDILVVDEVLAVGDAQFQKKCLGKIGEVASGGRTIFFVSHNMGAVRALCSKVLWLEEGRVRELGPSHELVEAYLRAAASRASSSVSLRDKPRVTGQGSSLRICAIGFNAGAPLLHGAPLHVSIEYETSAPTAGAAFGFGLCSPEGTRILSLDSDLHDAQRDLPAGERGTVEATLARLDLQPGRYLLDVGARSGNGSSLDYLPACAEIEVLPGPDTPSLIIRETGGVRAPATWRWLRADAKLPATLSVK